MNYKLKLIFLIVYTNLIFGQSVPVITWTVTPNDTICEGDTVHMIEAASNGCTNGIFYFPGAFPGTIPSTGTVSIVAFSSVSANGCAAEMYFTLHGSEPFTFCASGNNLNGTGSNCYTIINLPKSASVSITASQNNPVCSSQVISFTATPTNGGSNPTYQWRINGMAVGTNSPNFTTTGLNNNDIISVDMISSSPCVSGSSSDSYTINVLQPQIPSVSISQPLTNICTGNSITFTASPSNGGTTPIYQWLVNGNNVGTNSSAYTLSNVLGGEQVSVVMTSNASCVTTNTVSSDVLTVFTTSPPSFTLISTSANVCPNEADTLIATGPIGASYSWAPLTGLTVINNDFVVAVNNAIGNYKYYINCELNGCVSKDSIIVNVIDNNCIDTLIGIFNSSDTIKNIIPNIFTPNGDGINDLLEFKTTNGELKALEIYNRWGVLVFSTKESEKTGIINLISVFWDGRSTSGESCQDGIYFYIFRIKDKKNELINYKGFATLIR